MRMLKETELIFPAAGCAGHSRRSVTRESLSSFTSVASSRHSSRSSYRCRHRRAVCLCAASFYRRKNHVRLSQDCSVVGDQYAVKAHLLTEHLAHELWLIAAGMSLTVLKLVTTIPAPALIPASGGQVISRNVCSETCTVLYSLPASAPPYPAKCLIQPHTFPSSFISSP